MWGKREKKNNTNSKKKENIKRYYLVSRWVNKMKLKKWSQDKVENLQIKTLWVQNLEVITITITTISTSTWTAIVSEIKTFLSSNKIKSFKLMKIKIFLTMPMAMKIMMMKEEKKKSM